MYQHLVYKVHRRVNWVQMGQKEHRCTLNDDGRTYSFSWHRTECEECFFQASIWLFHLQVAKHCASENKI